MVFLLYLTKKIAIFFRNSVHLLCIKLVLDYLCCQGFGWQVNVRGNRVILNQ